MSSVVNVSVLSSRAPNPVLSVLGRLLEGALNRVLARDPETLDRLGALDGRALTLTFSGTGIALRATVDARQLRIGPAFTGTSALRVAASPGSLLAMLLTRGADGSLAPGQVEIAGDAELARRLEHIASKFAPDFDEAFAKVFGDVIGFQLARAVRHGVQWARASAQALTRDTVDYLQEESRDLVSRPEIDGFLDDVDALRERGDRLLARAQRVLALRKAGA
ncbi:MAG: SCP2 sterol-binding domain-containing protein [Dokdonella sp.]